MEVNILLIIILILFFIVIKLSEASCINFPVSIPVHEITAGHRSGTISCVTDRIRFLPVTMTGRFSNFNSILYTEDRHELRVTGTKFRLPVTMFGNSEIFISGADTIGTTKT